MRFKKILAVLIGCTMLMPLAALAACNQNDDNYSLDGFDLENIETWFDEEKTDLPSLKQCQKITVGMSLTEVVRKIGKPQRDIGYGAIIFQFDIDDGSTLTVWFNYKYSDNNSDATENDTNILYVQSISFDHEKPDEKPDWYYHTSYKLNELYPWINELKVEDIQKVRYEHAYIGVAPGNLEDISYSSNKEDIENAYKILSSSAEAINPLEGQVCGGGYVKYDFLTAGGKNYSIRISNGNVYVDNKVYKFVGSKYKFKYSELDCHSFITNVDTYEVYDYENESVKIGDYDGLGEFEFQLIEGATDKTPSYRIKHFAEDVLVLSENQFMIEDEGKTYVFQITGDKNFAFLFND
ncbi:MAG: hypothetical protein K2O28_00290 [Clostridia bacterium]|nr:hypothetical protein [Clostridia bacterium]